MSITPPISQIVDSNSPFVPSVAADFLPITTYVERCMQCDDEFVMQEGSEEMSCWRCRPYDDEWLLCQYGTQFEVWLAIQETTPQPEDCWYCTVSRHDGGDNAEDGMDVCTCPPGAEAWCWGCKESIRLNKLLAS